MTTSSPVFRDPVRQVHVSRLFALSVAVAVVAGLFVAGGAQLVLPGLRAAMAEIYVGVPSWVFVAGGCYQLIAATMIIWNKTRVSGAMHAGAIALACIGFNLFGAGTLELIPLNIAAAAAAFFVAWHFRSRQAEGARSAA